MHDNIYHIKKILSDWLIFNLNIFHIIKQNWIFFGRNYCEELTWWEFPALHKTEKKKVLFSTMTHPPQLTKRVIESLRLCSVIFYDNTYYGCQNIPISCLQLTQWLLARINQKSTHHKPTNLFAAFAPSDIATSFWIHFLFYIFSYI